MVQPGKHLNRCAMVLSMTLGKKPRPNNLSMAGRNEGYIREEYRGEHLKDYYAIAKALAQRLADDWGGPDVRGPGDQVFGAVLGRPGVVFFDGVQPHVDLWDGARTGTGFMPFLADFTVWFWELAP
jgi:hypothetical protein